MRTLDQLSVGATASVRALHLSERDSSRLRAVGLFEGIMVTPLRFAPWGGPIHLRTSTGSELALDRELARAVEVDPT